MLRSNANVVLSSLETFGTTTAEDGICSHCGQYDTQLTRDGYCRRDDDSDGLDCWRQRVIKALGEGRATMLSDGTLIFVDA